MRLEEMVETKPAQRRRVSKLLSEFTQSLLALVKAEEPRTVLLAMQLLRDYNLRRVDFKTTFDPILKSYTKNVICHRFRAYRDAFRYVYDIKKKQAKEKWVDNDPE